MDEEQSGTVWSSSGEPLKWRTVESFVIEVDPDARRYGVTAGPGVEVDEIAPGFHVVSAVQVDLAAGQSASWTSERSLDAPD